MIKVFGFYKFFRVDSLEKCKVLLNKILIKKKIRGTIIISKEGINGTVSGKSQDVKSLISKTETNKKTGLGILYYCILLRLDLTF